MTERVRMLPSSRHTIDSRNCPVGIRTTEGAFLVILIFIVAIVAIVAENAVLSTIATISTIIMS
jgi:hypothetical protein